MTPFRLTAKVQFGWETILCPIEGIGSINIRMFDGVVRKLQGVRYVPKLKKNLISLGTLDAEGCSYTGQGGALKVSR